MTEKVPAPAEEIVEIEEGASSVESETPSERSDPAARPEASPPSDEPASAQTEESDPEAPAAAEISSEPSAAEAESSTEADEDSPDQLSIHSLKVGQHLQGRVKNITGFGAFVDIGIPQDGLVHISKLSRRKVDKVTDVVSEGQEVEVWVQKVDRKRGRISLTMVKPIKLRMKDIKEGAELEGTVSRLESYGAFVNIGSDRDGLVHISQVTHDYVDQPDEVLSVGDKVKVKVLKVNRKKRQVDLSIKALLPPPMAEVRKEEMKQGASGTDVATETESDEPVPTAMALAYAAFQSWDSDEEEEAAGEEGQTEERKKKKQEEMDSIVARTLAARDD